MAEIQVKRDTYTLGKSSNGTLNGNKVIKLDVTLEANANKDKATIAGKITGSDDSAVDGAQIIVTKIVDGTETFIGNYMSSSEGIYIIDGLDYGTGDTGVSYKLLALKKNVGVSGDATVTVSSTKKGAAQDLQLGELIELSGVISGKIVKNGAAPSGIVGAAVLLYSGEGDDPVSISDENLVAITYANADGEFAFTELEAKKYAMIVSHTQYEGEFAADIELAEGDMFKEVSVTVTDRTGTEDKVIAGVIKDNGNNPIEGADVILYKEQTDSAGNYLPVQLSKTNSQGAYVFVVSDAGTYQVRSNAMETITVTIPEP